MLSRLKKALPSLPGRKKKDGSSAPQGDGISNSEEAAAVSPANPSKSGEISSSATPATASASASAAVAAVGGFDTARRFTKAWDWGNDAELEQLIGDACCYSAQDGEFEGKAEVIEALRKDSLWGKHCVAIESGPSKGEAHGTVVTKISAKVNPSVWNGMMHTVHFVETLTFASDTGKVSSIARESAAKESFLALGAQMMAVQKRLRDGMAEKRELEGKGEKGWGPGDLAIGLRVIAGEHEKAYLTREPLTRADCQFADHSVVLEAEKWLHHAWGAYSGDVSSLLARLNTGLEAPGYTADDIVATAFHANMGRAGHTLVIDKVNRAVVLSIKGTSSIPDVVNDMCALPVRFEDKYWTHEGMSVSARWFADNLGPMIAQRCKETGFKCVVTGHSLGAGIACITTYLLRRQHAPDAVGWAFACPSCANEELCVEMEGYVTVIVSELDVVPRLSLASFETLRREVSEADWSKVVSPKLRARLGKMQDAVSWGKGKAGQVAAMTPQMAVKAMKGGGKAVAAGMEKAKFIMGSANRKSSGGGAPSGGSDTWPDSASSPKAESGLGVPQYPPGIIYCLTRVQIGSSDATLKVRMLLAKREWVDHIILCSGLVAAHKTDSYLRQLEEAQAEWTAT